MTEDFLMHHGILGQKWGERRYQNKDGSLTPEGREHYGYSGEPRHPGKRRVKDEIHGELTRSQKKTLKKVERLTELRSRFDDEQTYKDLVNKYGEKGLERIVKSVDSGKAYVRALSEEHNRQKRADDYLKATKLMMPVVSFIPTLESRVLASLVLSEINTKLSEKNRNRILLNENDAFNLAQLIADDRVKMDDSLMDKIVESDVFDNFGYATKSIEDLRDIKQKREISPIVKHFAFQS